MPSEATLQIGNTQTDQAWVQYSPGFLDRLVRGIDRLPIPAWLFYPSLLGIIWLVINSVRWLEGSAPFGSLDAPYAFAAFYPAWGLASLHYLDMTAGQAFENFRPALGKSSAEAARLCYELTTVPMKEARIVAGAGVAFTLLIVVVGRGLRPSWGSGAFFWTIAVVAMVGFVITGELLYHTVRQLRMVSLIHAAAENIDLFHYGPLYSFSGLTARTGIVFVLILCYDLVVNPETLTNGPLLALNAIILLLSAACFVLPLQGMHYKIIAEKRRLQWDVDRRLAAIVQHLYAKVDDLELRDADAVNKTINSLIATQDLIGKIPTWPWRPETFTAFFSALALPVVVFLIQTLLKTILGFK